MLLVMLPALVACEKITAEDIESALGNNSQNNNGASSSTSSGQQNGGDKKDYKDPKDPSTYVHESSEHFVVYQNLTSNPSETHYLFLSLTEWKDVFSANYDGGEMVQTIVNSYREGTLTGWRLPTKEEAKILKDRFESTPPYLSDELSNANAILKESGGDLLHAWDAKSSMPAWRYLCENGTYSFSLKLGTTISEAAKTANTTYHLRLVRDSIQKK